MTDVQDLNGRLEFGVGDPEDIEIVTGRGDDVLVLARQSRRFELVAKTRRQFELLAVGGLVHLTLEPGEHSLRVSFQKARQVVQVLAVRVFVDSPHTGT